MSSTATSTFSNCGAQRSTAIERSHQGDEARSGGRSGKGRRRRAAAEQRRIEQQRWGEYIGEDDDFAVQASPSPPNRRRNRRVARRAALQEAQDDIDDYIGDYSAQACQQITATDAVDLDLALAISLSLQESGVGSLAMSHLSEASLASSLDMSYESLVKLENVRVVATEEVVERLKISTFHGHQEGDTSEEICPICQGEFVEGDVLLDTPCCHAMHKDCGQEWLLKYSKACPICKKDVCE